MHVDFICAIFLLCINNVLLVHVPYIQRLLSHMAKSDILLIILLFKIDIKRANTKITVCML